MAQTIIVADDHPLFRAALKQAVSQAVPDAETVEVDSIKALQAAVESHPDADLVLLDLNMPGAHGFSGLVFMRGQYPGLPVVVVSGSEELQVMRRSIDYGASGFIPKSECKASSAISRAQIGGQSSSACLVTDRKRHH